MDLGNTEQVERLLEQLEHGSDTRTRGECFPMPGR